MKKIRPCPVKDRHKIVSHYFDTEFCKVFQCCLIIFNILIPCGQTDLNIIMDVDTLHHIHVKTRTLNARSHFLYLFHRPDLSRLLVVKCPDKSAHARNLPDHLRCNIIISIAIPAKCHLHPGTSICYANTILSSTASCPVSAVLLASG